MGRIAEGSTYKHDDGKRWIARLQFNDPATGKRRQKKRICATFKLAQTELKNLFAEVENESADSVTYRDLDKFFRDKYVHKASIVGGQKISGYRQDLKKIKAYLDRAVEHFGDRDAAAITFDDLNEFKRIIAAVPVVRVYWEKDAAGKKKKIHKNEPRSLASINHNLKWVRRVFAVAVEHDKLAKSPFKKGSRIIRETLEVERTRVLSPVEEKRLIGACDPFRKHIVPLIIFAIETAARRNEIQSVRWSDVDFNARAIRVENKWTTTQTTRLVPISARLRDTLAQLWQNSRKRKSAFVFGPSDFKKAFNGAISDADLKDVHFHDLRHTGITRMLERGISPPIVMKISGHRQFKTFLRYVNPSASSMAEIALALDKAA